MLLWPGNFCLPAVFAKLKPGDRDGCATLDCCTDEGAHRFVGEVEFSCPSRSARPGVLLSEHPAQDLGGGTSGEQVVVDLVAVVAQAVVAAGLGAAFAGFDTGERRVEDLRDVLGDAPGVPSATGNGVEDDEGWGQLAGVAVEGAADVVACDGQRSDAFENGVEGAERCRLVDRQSEAYLGDVGEVLVSELAVDQ